MRSKLFVPGNRPELFAKAMAGAADAVSFDLEDAVRPERKVQARADVAAFVRTKAALNAAKLVIVRVNAFATPQFEADIAALADAGLGLVNLPKVESVDTLLAVIGVLEREEKRLGTRHPNRLLLNIETPTALHNVAALASAHPRVAGLQLGLADLFEPYGIDRTDTMNVHAAMFAVRIAASAAGIFACDAAFADVQDDAGYRAEAAMARRLGYIGKTCIHPRQVALANDVFQPSGEELAAARRVVQASRSTDADGVGAFIVDGRMVDLPFLKRAEALVAAADRGNDGERTA
jgi:citrate lyase subunit beta/citryl-CoA lyase